MRLISIQPLFFGNVIEENNNIIIVSGFKKVIFKKISKKEKQLLNNIISLCDGINPIKEIILKLYPLGHSKKRIIFLLKYLLKQKILVDSREVYLHFHPYLNNLTPFYHKLTKEEINSLAKKIDSFKYPGKHIPLKLPRNSDFLKLITRRRTIREFDIEKTISFQALSGLLYAAYGISKKDKINKELILKRVIPSAGALYPLHIYCVLLKKIEHLLPGIYYFNKKSIDSSIIKIKKIFNREELIKLLPGSESMAKNASIILIIVCNFKRISQKYSNRGYMYGLLEAGHIGQNIYLYCSEQNLAVVEIGGFNDIELSKFLGLNYPEVAPLVCFLVGVPSQRSLSKKLYIKKDFSYY